jgi:DnaJ-class molecular chaperone
MWMREIQDLYGSRPCQDCAGIGRAWIEGRLQDCPECGGSGWERAVSVPSQRGLETAVLQGTDPPPPGKTRV